MLIWVKDGNIESEKSSARPNEHANSDPFDVENSIEIERVKFEIDRKRK